METDTALRVLRSGLKEAVARSPLSSREISRRLGRHWGYLTRVLNGRLRLKVRETAELLELLDVEAEDFFDAVFPLGGRRLGPPGRSPFDALDRSGGMTALELAQQIARRHTGPPPGPRQLTAWAGRLLREILRRHRRTQRQVSRRLGLSPDALGLALRGNTQLTFWHLFATLEEVGMEPGRFFAELFGPGERAVTDQLRWLQLLDQIEAALSAGEKAPAEPFVLPRLPKKRPGERSGMVGEGAAGR